MIVAVATFFSAPLETHANPLKTPLHTTAPWYFLWLQGMLKLGDKTWWGVIWPSIIFLILFAVPYLDPGPSRLGKNRKVGITVGLVTCVMLVLLTHMGTGLWGVSAPPAAELVQEFIPEEGVGRIRLIPYDQLLLGSYDTDKPAAWPAGEMGAVMAEMKEAAERESSKGTNNFFESKMNVTIEDWQANLKRMTITVFWREVPEGGGDLTERNEAKTFYFHKHSNYELLH